MKALHTGMCRSRTVATSGGRWRQRGATLAEYLPPLLFVLMIALPAWEKYGEVVRQQMAHAAERFADYYYRGWFWPEEDRVAGAPPSQPGRGDGGGPDAGGDNGVGNGNGTDEGNSTGGSGLGDDPFAGAPGTGVGNPFAPDPGSAGGDGPLQCATPGAGGGSPTISPVGNAATYTQIGNPIDLGTGNKLQTETDYRDRRPAGLHFVRHYNSVLGAQDRGLGHGWRHSYQRAIVPDGAEAATVWRDDGSQYRFEWRDGQWRPPLGIVEQLAPIDDEQGVRRGWTYTTADGSVERYDTGGRLLRLDHLGGQRQTLHYDETGRLVLVADARGDRMSLRWRGDHLSAVTTPDGDRLIYDYDDRLDLVEVVRRGEGLRGLFAGLRTPERRYHYDDARHPHALTGLDDATGRRFATWGYDDLGRAVSSEHGDGAGKITLDYQPPVDPDSRERRVTVTNALGHRATYTLEPARTGKWRLRSIDGKPMLNCAAVAQRHHYDERGFLAVQHSDGIASAYRRDARGRLIDERHGLRIDTVGHLQPTPGAVRIDYLWQGQALQPLSATRYGWMARQGGDAHWQPVTRHDWQRDPRGRLVSAAVTDLTTAAEAGATRTTQYRYIDRDPASADRTAPRLQILEVTDPRGHVTTHRYDADERLQAIVNALGQQTRFAGHTRAGQPQRIDLPDGQQLRITYDTHGRPTRLTRTGGALTETTTVDHDAEGRPVTVKHPDGSEQHLTYNAAGQLIEITNGWGERIELTPNRWHGHWEQLQIVDAGGIPRRHRHRSFNPLGQLASLRHDERAEIRYRYDARGNLIEQHEGHENPAHAELARITRARYDSLDRLLTWTDAAGVATHVGYGISGALASVEDGNGNVTHYRRNGFGEIVHQHSPASGDEWRRHDGNGNLIAKAATAAALDARETPSFDGIRFQHDALNRLTIVDYPGEADDIAYTYDQTGPEHGNGIGRLTRIETATQTIDYRYDDLGRRIAETTHDKDSDGKTTHTTTQTYHYDKNSRLTAIGYPDGSTVRYRYDKERITRITYREPAGTTHTIVDDIAHAPFGGPIRWTYGNGLTQAKTLDRDGRITDITLRPKRRGLPWSSQSTADNAPLWSQRYDYDLYQNIEQLTVDDTTHRYGYDTVDRLIEEAGKDHRIAYRYDPVGNRIREQRNGTTTDYRYGPGNRLIKRGDTEVLIDDRGNLIKETSATDTGQDQDGPSENRRFDYSTRNRPTAFYTNDKLTARYDYNALGLRIGKTVYTEQGEAHTRFSHAPDTRLLAEQANNKAIHYVWLGSQPVAAIETDRKSKAKTAIRYLHPDHLGAPRMATDAAKKVIWRWYSDAFGTTPAETDPDGDGEHVQIALRFPGQYHDAESGLYYNVFRYYDSAAGRYTQSDPIGLVDGSNSYGYVHQNPLTKFDELGLFTVYLGGAGMDGPYIPDQIASLDAAGVEGVVAGKRTADDGFVGNVLDAAAVLKARERWKYNTGFTPGPFGVPYKTEQDWSWSSLGLAAPCLAAGEQINLIGYSWGSLVAAQTAAFYADKGVYIDNVVLIGSPISSDFLDEIRSNKNIGNVIVKDLRSHGDPIYAGMPVSELMSSMPMLLRQFMNVNEGEGHFYYNPNSDEGRERRGDLAEELFLNGLR